MDIKYFENGVCEPDILEKENKYHSADFNCNNCNQSDCAYWILYNGHIAFEDFDYIDEIDEAE